MMSRPRALVVVSGIAAAGAVIGGAAYIGLVTAAVPIASESGDEFAPSGRFEFRSTHLERSYSP
jgi:hypothetical protein